MYTQYTYQQFFVLCRGENIPCFRIFYPPNCLKHGMDNSERGVGRVPSCRGFIIIIVIIVIILLFFSSVVVAPASLSFVYIPTVIRSIERTHCTASHPPPTKPPKLATIPTPSYRFQPATLQPFWKR